MPVPNRNPLANREAAINAILASFDTKISDVTYPTVSFLTNRVGEVQTDIKWPVNVGGVTTRRKNVVADSTTTATDANVPCKLDIGDYAITHEFSINLVQLQQAISRGATEEVRNLVTTHLNSGITEIIRDFNRLIYTGTGTPEDAGVVGVLQALKPSVNYGAIDNALWKCVNTRLTGNAFNASVLYAHERALSEKGLNYTMVLAHPKFTEQYKNEFDSRRTFDGNGPTAVDLGLGDCYFNGRPVVADPSCPESIVIFVDQSKVQLSTFKVPNDAVVDRLHFKVAELPVQTAYGVRMEIGMIPQLVLRDRRAVSAIALNNAGKALLEIA